MDNWEFYLKEPNHLRVHNNPCDNEVGRILVYSGKWVVSPNRTTIPFYLRILKNKKKKLANGERFNCLI